LWNSKPNKRLGARSHCFCCLDPIPPLRGGGRKRENWDGGAGEGGREGRGIQVVGLWAFKI